MKLKTDRSLVMYILLGIVTCNIYCYVYIYNMIKDTNTICEGDGQETPGLLMLILLSIVTCGVYPCYFYYKMANRLQQNAPRYGIELKEGGSQVLLWWILGLLVCAFCQWYSMYIIIKNLNTLSEAYNGYVDQYNAENAAAN